MENSTLPNYIQKYWIDDKDKIIQYRIDNKDKIKQNYIDHKDGNKQYYKEDSQKYYIDNRDKCLSYQKEYNAYYKDDIKLIIGYIGTSINLIQLRKNG